MYEDFCKRLVGKHVIEFNDGKEPHFGDDYIHTPGECAKYVQQADDQPKHLYIGIAYDQTVCGDDTVFRVNGVNMTEYGVKRCREMLLGALFGKCGEPSVNWHDCMRFTIFWGDEEHGAPETLPRITIS